MEIIVKPRNLTGLAKYIEVGATAFIFGVKDFSICPTSIINIKTYLFLKNKYPNIKIYLSLNKVFTNKEINKLTKFLIKLSKLKVDGVLFYDVAVVNIIKDNKLSIPLIWNQDFFVTNYNTINYYLKKGITSCVLSNEIIKEEVEEITKNTKSNLFMNAFGYQMISHSKRKLLTDYYHYKKIYFFNKIAFIKNNNDDNKYQIIEDNEGTSILNNNILNLIREIPFCKENNIKGLILNEKGLNHNNFMKALIIFNDCLKENIDNISANEKIEKLFLNNDTGFFYKKTIFKVKK